MMEDFLDTRAIMRRIEYLEGQQDTAKPEELATLKALLELLRDSSGDLPDDGVQLIRDSYLTEYAKKLAADIGTINPSASAFSWPLNHIDWEAAADELRADYSSVEFGGVTYWYHL